MLRRLFRTSTTPSIEGRSARGADVAGEGLDAVDGLEAGADALDDAVGVAHRLGDPVAHEGAVHDDEVVTLVVLDVPALLRLAVGQVALEARVQAVNAEASVAKGTTVRSARQPNGWRG
jgi:hypothetical protein